MNEISLTKFPLCLLLYLEGVTNTYPNGKNSSPEVVHIVPEISYSSVVGKEIRAETANKPASRVA